MSLKPDPIQPVPEETARVARAVFRKGNPLLSLRDELGAIFADAQHVATAAAINLDRLAAWFRAVPRATTRTSRFAALAA